MLEPRSREGRKRAETALVRILWNLREAQRQPIVLGGLVPDVLMEGIEPHPPVHLGTTDVDVFVVLGVDDDEATLAAMEDALRAAGFSPDIRRRGGWRWLGEIDGTPVKVELLGDRDDAVDESVTQSSSRQLGVLNLRGTGFVARDYDECRLTGPLADGSEAHVSARFAGLQGFLLAKAFAARSRGAPRDFYDLVYVLSHNRLGGPRAAAQAIREGVFRDDLPSIGTTLRELRECFRDAGDAGPTAYASEMSLGTGATDPAQLRQDAIGAVTEFLDELEAE